MGWFDILTKFFRRSMQNSLYSICSESEVTLEQAFDLFRDLSTKGAVQEIVFANGEVTIILDDRRRFRFDMHNPVSRLYTIPFSGNFEAKETAFLRTLIRPNQNCVDAGGSFGWYTVLLSNLVGEQGTIYSFEPLPQNYAQLGYNISLNGCRNVVLEQYALAEVSGDRDLFLPDIGVSGSFQLHDYVSNYERVTCKTITLDEYCRKNNINQIDFIKADIEGAEWLMLKGGRDILARCKPVLFLEIQPHSTKLFGYHPSDLFKWLNLLGYIPYVAANDGSLQKIINIYDPLPDHNFIFFPESGFNS
jgi:FkbM family methyltransferase